MAARFVPPGNAAPVNATSGEDPHEGWLYEMATHAMNSQSDGNSSAVGEHLKGCVQCRHELA